MPTKEAALKTDPRHTLEELYKAHADPVLRYAQRRVPMHDAEEVVAQTFLVVWRRLPEVPSDPLPWLIGIARNAIRNMDRAGRRRSLLQVRIASTPALDGKPDNHPQLSEDLRRALESLSSDDREVLLLIAWDELDHSEAAVAMGWTKANFRLRLHRARKRLKKRLEESPPTYPQTVAHSTPAPEEAR
jgi:RNA polymerase sigma-70 factor (ECF subfamily)